MVNKSSQVKGFLSRQGFLHLKLTTYFAKYLETETKPFGYKTLHPGFSVY